MFTRIFSMFMAVILLVTGSLAAISFVTLRNQQISARLDGLKTEAREVAWLASRSSLDSFSILTGTSAWNTYLNEKAAEIYDGYGAYILVVDRWGHVMDNMRTAFAEDPDFIRSLDTAEINDALMRVLGGEEIAVRLDQGSDPTFTVGVPYAQGRNVLGAVFIRTKAQTVESGYERLLGQVLAVALAALLLAAAGVWFYVRSVMKPLGQMTAAAGRMADGDFSVRADTTGNVRELQDLGAAFNTMADRLDETEQSRRDFVANVSHELRSPITSIRGFAEGMRDGVIPPEQHTKYLGVVADETARLSRLIGDLLSLSRLERSDAAPELTTFDICEMLRRAVIRRIGDLDAHRLEPVPVFESEHLFVRADSGRIEQVIVNLLDNAVKFTPDGGRIELRVRTEGGKRLITVADNGIGIAPEDRQKVFDRFFTEDRAHTSGHGTGLGLSICRRILQMHGETIRLDDVPEGASFTFTLPAADPPAPAAEQQSAETESGKTANADTEEDAHA